MINHNNLYHPVKYMIEKQVRRVFSEENGGPIGDGDGSLQAKEYIEGIKLERDARGRLATVTGWEYIKYTLNFANGGAMNGLLQSVDVVHQITGKHLNIELVYDDKRLLVEVRPKILDDGTGLPGKIDVPNVTTDYYAP